MKYTYEAWVDSDSISLATSEGIKWQKDHGLIGNSAVLLHVINADIQEEANAVHHIKMGWEPYKPMGKPQKCPNNCDSIYYPEGSGECPRCGKIG